VSRIYATDERGERFLRYLECDAVGCTERIKSHREIAQSGWTTRGINDPKQGGVFEWDYCPRHS